MLPTLFEMSTALNEEEEGLIKGYKRRCVLETRTVKAKIAQGLPASEWRLTIEERQQAAQDAVKSLRDKYVCPCFFCSVVNCNENVLYIDFFEQSQSDMTRNTTSC